MSENNEINQIINQAKSEARSDNFKKLIVKNSKILVVIAGLVVVGAISFFIFNAYQKSQEAKFSEILQQSIVDQKSGDLEKTKGRECGIKYGYRLETIELDMDGEVETTCTVKKLGEILDRKKKERLSDQQTRVLIYLKIGYYHLVMMIWIS